MALVISFILISSRTQCLASDALYRRRVLVYGRGAPVGLKRSYGDEVCGCDDDEDQQEDSSLIEMIVMKEFLLGY